MPVTGATLLADRLLASPPLPRPRPWSGHPIHTLVKLKPLILMGFIVTSTPGAPITISLFIGALFPSLWLRLRPSLSRPVVSNHRNKSDGPLESFHSTSTTIGVTAWIQRSLKISQLCDGFCDGHTPISCTRQGQGPLHFRFCQFSCQISASTTFGQL